MNEKEKIHQKAKQFVLSRFGIAIHYVKRFYTKEEAIQILKDEWDKKDKSNEANF